MPGNSGLNCGVTDGVEVCVRAGEAHTAEHRIDRRLRALRLERLRIDVGARPHRGGDVRRDAELRQQVPADEFDEVDELVVEPGDSHPRAATPHTLFDADVQIPAALWSDRADARTRGQRRTRRGLPQKVVQRSVDRRRARRFDAAAAVEGEPRVTPERVGRRLAHGDGNGEPR